METIDKWKPRFDRERGARREAEQLLENKSRELYEANRKLEEQIRSQGTLLAEKEELFASVFRASMDGIILLDQNGKLVEVNHAGLRMLGHPSKIMIGMGIPDLFAKKDHDLAQQKLKEVISTGYCRYEADLTRVDGTSFPAEIVGSRALVGGKTFVTETIRDITQRRRNIKEIKQARDEAEEANASKSLFLASMSHEIRTPLNGVLGFTDAVLHTELNEEQRQHLELVQSSGKILLHMIDDLLDFSRIESGKLVLEERNFSLRKVVQDVLTIQSEASREKRLDLTLKIDENIPTEIRGDRIRIRQVITNLVSNAFKFTHEGSVTVTVSRDQERVRITVADTGIGFDEAMAEKLFESFTQADASTTRKYGGTGLGLAISRKLAVQMDGSIKAHGKKGKGAIFIFCFPLLEAREEKSSTLKDAHHKKPHPGETSGHKILVAEDNKINARLIVLMLNRLGYPSVVVFTGTQVIETLKKNPSYSVVLMDRHMQEMDGIEATLRIRRGEAGEAVREIPILAVTASTMDEDRKYCLEVGMNGFLTKPLHPGELESQLSLVLVDRAGS